MKKPTYYNLNHENKIVPAEQGPFVSTADYEMMIMKKNGYSKILLSEKDNEIHELKEQIKILKFKIEASDYIE